MAGLRLRFPGQTCVLADTLLGAEAERYDHGILCKRTLRPLRIYTKGNPCAATTPPHPSRPRLPLLRCEALTRSAADNMRSSGSAPLPAARCSVACCTLQRCVLHVAALQRCTVAPHRLGAGLTQATAKRLAIEISQRGRVISSFLLPWHQIGWIDAQTKRQARACVGLAARRAPVGSGRRRAPVSLPPPKRCSRCGPSRSVGYHSRL